MTVLVAHIAHCAACGAEDTVEVSQEGLQAREAGALVQDAFPELSPAERELHFQSHICGTCFDRMFGFGED